MGLPPLQESGPNVRFCCLCRQWGRVGCKDGQEKSQSYRTTDAMLPSRLLLERFIVRAERWRHHPRVGRGRPVSARPTPAPRQPISVVAAAHQPPHTLISVIIAQHCISLDIAPTSVTVTWPWLPIWNIKWKFNTSLPYFGVKLSCVCLMFVYRKR